MTFTIPIEFIVSLLVNGLIIFLIALVLPFVKVKNLLVAIYVAAMIALVNMGIRWLLEYIQIDENLSATFLVAFLTNVVSVFMVDKVIAGFNIRGILWTVVFAALVVILNYLFMHYLFGDIVSYLHEMMGTSKA